MDFDFTDDERQLRDAVQAWVARGYDDPRRRAIVAAGGFSDDAWRELADLGLTGLAIAEADGGLGLGPVAAMLALEALGHGLVLEPLADVALVAPALLAHAPAAMRATWLPRIAAGDARVVLAHQERAARYRLERVDTAAQARDGAWTLDGAKTGVPIGDRADAFVVPARVRGAADDPDGIALFLVERAAAGVTTRGYPQADGTRAAELVLRSVPATPLVEAGAAFPVLEAAVDTGIAALAAQSVGTLDRLFALTTEYLATRRQFGVPIGTFQALRHRVADMKMALELARSMSYCATLRLGAAPDVRRRALAQAKVQLGRSMRELGQAAIQLHGGIGMTDEVLASHCFKRLTVAELRFGDTFHHLGEVARRMTDEAGVV